MDLLAALGLEPDAALDLDDVLAAGAQDRDRGVDRDLVVALGPGDDPRVARRALLGLDRADGRLVGRKRAVESRDDVDDLAVGGDDRLALLVGDVVGAGDARSDRGSLLAVGAVGEDLNRDLTVLGRLRLQDQLRRRRVVEVLDEVPEDRAESSPELTVVESPPDSA
ncbi:MAG: hypothetical protein U0R24_03115 [Solirubrobacterales bacterium]